MPFNAQGVWTEDTFNQPGFGPAAGLDVTNALQTYQNYRRTREAQVLDTLLRLREHPEDTEGVASTPEGGQALSTLGVSPETAHNLYQTAPSTKFQTMLTSPEAANWEPEDIEKAAVGVGAVSPNQYLTGYNRTLGLRARQARTSAEERPRILNALTKALQNETQTIDANDPQGQQKAAMRAVSAVRSIYPDADPSVFDEFVQQHGGAISGITGAKQGELESRTAEHDARVTRIMELLEPTKNLLAARASAEDQLAALRQVQQDHLSGKVPMTQRDFYGFSLAAQRAAEKYDDDALTARGTDKLEAKKHAEEMRVESARLATLAGKAPETNSKAARPSGSVYKTADDVKMALNTGKISRDDALKILRSQFGYK